MGFLASPALNSNNMGCSRAVNGIPVPSALGRSLLSRLERHAFPFPDDVLTLHCSRVVPGAPWL